MSRNFSGFPQPAGLVQEGCLYAVTICSSRYDVHWASAELRTAELLSCIQPNEFSEKQRKAVAEYVKGLIESCFDCQVFTFGSVPLKTYLPDGDIDLTAFSKHQSLKDTWAFYVQNILEHEERRRNPKFCVKEVQYINAEVKIVKCLVENIVVDISFNQLGGLCTLCFLDEVDRLIERDHLFKRSIILVKAWCYYESRLLGAPHGLLSTYALETLVLYIFNVFHTSLRGPLEVLFTFLDYFSNFDWDKYCVSLWGPVPLESIPDLTAEPPLQDGGKLLLSSDFLEACSDAYSVVPRGQDTYPRAFVGKYLNIVDPLRTNNNLGRSVNKASFFRIRSAFSLGARKMAKLFESSDQDIAKHLDNFFSSTWKSHQNGFRRDAPDFSFPPLQSFDHMYQGQISYRSTPDAMAISKNKETSDKNQAVWKSELQGKDFQDSSEVSTSQNHANTAIHFRNGDGELQTSEHILSPDSISRGEVLKSLSKGLSGYEKTNCDDKQGSSRGRVISTDAVDSPKKDLLSRTKSFGDSLSAMGEMGESFQSHTRPSTSDGRLEDHSYSLGMNSSRLPRGDQDLAVEQMDFVSGKERSPRPGNISRVKDWQEIHGRTDVTGLGVDSLTEKVLLESELNAVSRSRNERLHTMSAEGQAMLGGWITQNDSRSITSSNQILTTSKQYPQRLSELTLSEPHDQIPGSHASPFSLLPHMPVSVTPTPPGFVGPISPLELSLDYPSSTVSDFQNKVFSFAPTMVAMQVPQGPVSSPVQSYLEIPIVAHTIPVVQNFKDIGGHSQFWQQKQEQLQQFSPEQPCSYTNTSAAFSKSQEDAKLNQYNMDVSATTEATQGSSAPGEGRIGFKEPKSVRGKGGIREIKDARRSSSSSNVNTSSCEGLLVSSGDAPQESLNRSLISVSQKSPRYATVSVNRSNVVSPAVPSECSNELTVPLMGGQLSVGHSNTFSPSPLEIPSTEENPARGPAVANDQASEPSRYVAGSVSFPTFSHDNPFHVSTQGPDHGFGSEVGSDFHSCISHDDDNTVSNGDRESNPGFQAYYGAGESLKAAGTAESSRLQFASSAEAGTILESSRDLLSSDFMNHRCNLEFGRWCQDPGINPFLYSPSLLQPPNYIQGPLYPEGLHRPTHADIFSFSQVPGNVQGSIPGALLMQGYGPITGTFSGPVPGALSIGGDLHKPQTGTGTYLPLRHGPYNEAPVPGIRYRHGTLNPDQGRSRHMSGASRRRGIGHRKNNIDGYSQAQIDIAVNIDRHRAEGKLGNRNTWQKSNQLISAYPPATSGLVVPVSIHGPSNGFPGIHVFGNSPDDPGVMAPLSPSPSPAIALHCPSGQLEFGSFGPIQIGSVPGEFNLGQVVGNVQNDFSTTVGASPDAFVSFPERDTRQTLGTGQQRSICTYQLREDDFPPLPLHGQQGGGSVKSNVDD